MPSAVTRMPSDFLSGTVSAYIRLEHASINSMARRREIFIFCFPFVEVNKAGDLTRDIQLQDGVCIDVNENKNDLFHQNEKNLRSCHCWRKDALRSEEHTSELQ